MVSCNTCITSPIACCTARLELRSRTLISRTTPTISGAITIASRVSFQLSHSIHASNPISDRVSRKITVSTLVAAAVTWVTS